MKQYTVFEMLAIRQWEGNDPQEITNKRGEGLRMN